VHHRVDKFRCQRDDLFQQAVQSGRYELRPASLLSPKSVKILGFRHIGAKQSAFGFPESAITLARLMR